MFTLCTDGDGSFVKVPSFTSFGGGCCCSTFCSVLVRGLEDILRPTVAGLGEAGCRAFDLGADCGFEIGFSDGWCGFDFGVVCGVRMTRGLARGDFVCRDPLGVAGDAGVDLLVPL